MMNSASIATGAYPGSHGFYGNVVYAPSAKGRNAKGAEIDFSAPAFIEDFGVVEAVKTVSDLYAPIEGEVVEVNEALTDNPALVNQEPFGDGWMIRIRPVRNDDVKQLLDHREYAQHVEEQHA